MCAVFQVFAHCCMGSPEITSLERRDDLVMLGEGMAVGRRPVLREFPSGQHDRIPDRIHDPVQLGQKRISRGHGDQLTQSQVKLLVLRPVGGCPHAVRNPAGLGQVTRGGVDRGVSGQFGLKPQARHHCDTGTGDLGEAHDNRFGAASGGRRCPQECAAPACRSTMPSAPRAVRALRNLPREIFSRSDRSRSGGNRSPGPGPELASRPSSAQREAVILPSCCIA